MSGVEKMICDQMLAEAKENGQLEVKTMTGNKGETIEQYNIWVEGASEIPLNYHMTRIDGEWVYVHRCL